MSAEKSDRDSEKNTEANPPQITLQSGKAYTNPTGDKQNHSEKPKRKIPEWWLVWLEGGLIPVGIVALVIYYCQLSEMRKSTDAATKAADIAEKSLQITRLDERAWVGVQNITGIPVAGQPFNIAVTIKNSGKTVAKGTSTFVICELLLKDATPSFAFEDKKALFEIDSRSISAALLLPNGQLQVNYPFEDGKPLAQAVLNKIASGENTVFVHGKIFYEDVFNCPPWTTFCSYLASGASGGFAPYQTHNDEGSDPCP